MSGDLSGVAPPLSIPNRVVKRTSGDDTWVERPRENISLPDLLNSLIKYDMG